MIVGTEWLIEVFDADENALRDVEILRDVFRSVIRDLNLKTLGEPFWHQFGGERGITGLTALTESHLACHTYPEYRTATFNLYCCKNRPEWNWEARLKKSLGANRVKVTKIERGVSDVGCQMSDVSLKNPKSKVQNPKSKIAGGQR